MRRRRYVEVDLQSARSKRQSQAVSIVGSSQRRLVTRAPDLIMRPSTRRRGDQGGRWSASWRQAVRASPVSVWIKRRLHWQTRTGMQTQRRKISPASLHQRHGMPRIEPSWHPISKGTRRTTKIRWQTSRWTHTDPVARWALHDLGCHCYRHSC